jgi:hypothetical protein
MTDFREMYPNFPISTGTQDIVINDTVGSRDKVGSTRVKGTESIRNILTTMKRVLKVMAKVVTMIGKKAMVPVVAMSMEIALRKMIILRLL